MRLPYTLALPVIESTYAAVLARVRAADISYDVIEIWLDYIEDLVPEHIASFQRAAANRTLLFLTRRKESSISQKPLTFYQEIIRSIEEQLGQGTIWIDFDIGGQLDSLEEYIKGTRSIPLIVSYHHYSETPKDSELAQIAAHMRSFSPFMLKFSTFCQSDVDALRLLGFALSLRSQGLHYTVLGMGRFGLITRVFGPQYGSQIAYAPMDLAKASASGQITRDEFSKFQHLLKEIYER
jgi:3-dehydroquinate dehydratase type I